MPELTSEQKKLLEAAMKEKNREKAISLLGFAAKAGKLVSGTDKVCDEIRRHGCPDEDGTGNAIRTAGIVILASDASENTAKRVKNACRYYGVRVIESEFTSGKLAEKTGRISASAVCATFDRGFAESVAAAIGDTWVKDKKKAKNSNVLTETSPVPERPEKTRKDRSHNDR